MVEVTRRVDKIKTAAVKHTHTNTDEANRTEINKER